MQTVGFTAFYSVSGNEFHVGGSESRDQVKKMVKAESKCVIRDSAVGIFICEKKKCEGEARGCSRGWDMFRRLILKREHDDDKKISWAQLWRVNEGETMKALLL